MMGAIAFTTPLLLATLIVLPVLWWLLRAVPPAPMRRRFPGIALLLGLNDDETQTDTTPRWLLLLRILAVAAIIIGFAGPVLNPTAQREGSGPLLVVMDASWASARDWQTRIERVAQSLKEAARQARTARVVMLTDTGADEGTFRTADAALTRLPGAVPAPWGPDHMQVRAWADGLEGRFDTLWLSDGVAREGRSELAQTLADHGTVTVIEGARAAVALRPAQFKDGVISLTALRVPQDSGQTVTIAALGPDPNGVEQVLARADLRFDAGQGAADIALSLPGELRNRVRRFEIEGARSAGAVSLTDDALKRREVGLLSGRSDQEAQELLSPLHYLRRALVTTSDLIDGALADILLANPDVIVFADVTTLSETETADVADWVNAGGMLVRFAGPRVAASDLQAGDPLMPVRLRAGGRSVGGAMSWGAPKTLRAFTRDSPFFGLPIPDEVEVSAQVMAEPDPDLAARTIASLADGTPLVTRAPMGAGQVVLFHVTANAEWSSLPLSGLFVQMLERLAISTRSDTHMAEDLIGTRWVIEDMLDAFGAVRDADDLPAVAGEALAERDLGKTLPPGLYAGEDQRVALNVIATEDVLTKAEWSGNVILEGLTGAQETALKPLLLICALALLMIDIIASLAVAGRLFGPRAAAPAAALALLLMMPLPADAQSDRRALEATSEVVLAYVKTGDSQIDDRAQAGLAGLSLSLFQRTSVEPADPIAVDLETDELAFYPLIYWPVSANQPQPSPTAYAKLNRYLRTGGMIVFDTRDANVAGFGSSTPTGRKLQQLARPLDIPALEPVPADHVLTRSFYLLQDFPGRHASRDVWVEAAPANAETVEGLPFRNLNDGVTPVLIGGNDWASAWARDGNGVPLYPVGRGFGGERQRELAVRFGINLVMHVLTGNYKSDQVHIPALLDRLGN